MNKHHRITTKLFAHLLIFCFLFTGCSGKQEQQEQKDRTISEFSVSGITEFCVDEAGEYYYYTVSGGSVIYQCAADGTPVAQFTVDADNDKLDVQGYFGERPAEADDLSGLCIYGDTLYCFRNYKSTLMAVDITTGKSSLVTTFDKLFTINKMAAGTTTVLLMYFGEAGKESYVYHIGTQELEPVPVERLQGFAHAGEDTYWLNVQGEDGSYYFQEYQAATGALSEQYVSNFTYELTEMTYEKETGLLYGTLYSTQYLCFNPREPQHASRFQAHPVYQSPTSFLVAGGRLYILDKEEDTVYHIDPTAFVVENEPLKGYVTSELTVSEWAGYNIDLEVIGWDELALKVLAEDRDYDFVIMKTDMAEATAIREAMAYLPIPEETIQTYWEECWPCVRQGASHDGDIWMLPLEICARGLVYHEQNLAEEGLSIENITTIKDLCEAAKTLHSAGKLGWYELQPMQDYLLQNYLWKAQKEDSYNFDTPEFKAMMEFIREEYKGNDYSSAYYRNSYINLNNGEYYEEDNLLTSAERDTARRMRGTQKIYFEETGAYSTWNLEKYVGAEGLRVCKVPGMNGTEETVQVSGTFLILNPNSEKKEELLAFVSAMSEQYIANASTFLSSKAERYGGDTVSLDICELYRSGEMVFGMPEDLFTGYYRYVMGQDGDPEKVVKELNRVVNMYYGE